MKRLSQLTTAIVLLMSVSFFGLNMSWAAGKSSRNLTSSKEQATKEVKAAASDDSEHVETPLRHRGLLEDRRR
ncbi:MAG: hypothetical protein AB7F43_05880 [Bacteriovoracia bacterium]